MTSQYLRFRSRETVLEMGATRLLLLAWHVKRVCRWRRPSFSRWRIFCTRRSGICSYESSSNAFSCHHVTLGVGRPASQSTDLSNSWYEICAIEEYYAALSGKLCTEASEHISGPIFMNQEVHRCPELLVQNYHSTLRYIPEERTAYLRQVGSLKSRILCTFVVFWVAAILWSKLLVLYTFIYLSKTHQ